MHTVFRYTIFQNICSLCSHFFVHILKSKLAVVTPNRLNVQTNLGRFEALSSTNFPKVGSGRLLATAALWVRIQTSLKNTKQRHGQHTLARQQKIMQNFFQNSFRKYKLSTKFWQFFCFLAFLLFPILSIQIYFVLLFRFFAWERERFFVEANLFCFSFVLFVWKTRHSSYYSLITHHYLFFGEKLKKWYQFPTDLWW